MEAVAKGRMPAEGYTLVELTLVVGITAFMLSQAIPAMVERAAAARVSVTVDGVRALAAAAVRYRTDAAELADASGHYGDWPSGLGDLGAVLGHFRNDGTNFLNGVGRAITLHPPTPDGPLRIQTIFGDAAHARQFVFQSGPMACSGEDADCQTAGCDASAAPNFHACLFVPQPASESVHAHYALLDGSRPFLLDGTGSLEVQDGATPPSTVLSIDGNGGIDAEGSLTAGDGFEVTGDLRVVDGNLDIDGRVEAELVIAREIDAAGFAYCTSGTTFTIPAQTVACP